MVGPNFRTPIPPQLKSYTTKPLATSIPSRHHTSQSIHLKQDIPAYWWYLFKSKELNYLIETGLTNSPTIAAACAALQQAQEILNAQIGQAYLPRITGQAAGQKQRSSSLSSSLGSGSSSTDGSATGFGGSGGNIFNVFNTSINVTYNLDLFGGARRQTESLLASMHYQEYQLLAARLTLTANIVTTAIALAAVDEQIEVTRALIKTQEGQLAIYAKQYELGAIALTPKLSQETLLAQTKASLPPLQKSYAQYYHALTVLIGTTPNTVIPVIKLRKLSLPIRLPLTIPSKLVKQRPDVLAAQALLHVASANIGVETANLFPQINLSAATGSQALSIKQLFDANTKFWSLGAQLAQPIFAGGSLWANKRAAEAAFRQACAQYQQTVLQALQNVADILRAIELDAKSFDAYQDATISANRLLTLARKQYQFGAANYLDLLNAEQQFQQSRLAVVQAKAARYNDTASLFIALGGGWWNQLETK